MKSKMEINESCDVFFCESLTLPDSERLKTIRANSSKTGQAENQEITAQESKQVVRIYRNTCCNENLCRGGVFECLLPVLGATARRAQCPGRYFQETASADHDNFNQISMTIELKLRLKRFWPQGQAKRRKWGSVTDRGSISWQFLLDGKENRVAVF